MIYYLTYLKDTIGNNYLGINIQKEVVNPYMIELEEVLGEDEYIKYTKLQIQRDHGSYHITTINVMEYNSLCKSMGLNNFLNSLDVAFKYAIDDLKFIGLGSSERNENRSYFIVCSSEKLSQIRNRFNLPKQDFHITIGFYSKDVFGVSKDETTLISKKSKFIKTFKQLYSNDVNLNFLRDIENFDCGEDIKVIDINDSYLTVYSNGNISMITLMDDNKLRVTNEYLPKEDENSMKFLSNYEIKEKIKDK